MEIIIVAAAGLAAGAICALFYRKGVKEGMKLTKSAPANYTEADGELMKKYDIIMNYDPYGDKT